MSKNGFKHWDVLIIGGGAAGLVAAIESARLGNQVCILEQNDKLGKKILATGNGKCNYTNSNMSKDCYHGDENLIQLVLNSFTTEDCLAYFHRLGIYPKERQGYYYPNSEQASSVVYALQEELHQLGVRISLSTKVTDIISVDNGYEVVTNNGSYHGSNVIVACGLKASPNLGSDGSLLPALRKLGHFYETMVPALCGFYCKGMDFKKVSGVRVQAKVTAIVDENVVGQDVGELQLTDYGVSGIPVFQISRLIGMSIFQKKNAQIVIDFIPELTREMLYQELVHRSNRGSKAEFLLNGLLNQKLAEEMLNIAQISPELCVLELQEFQVWKLISVLKETTIIPTKSRSYEYAQVCAGGYSSKELKDNSLESKLHPGLFFAGEVLDVDGICGGYNLHFAWGSGILAAKEANERLR